MDLQTSLSSAGFAFKKYQKRLESLEIITVEDLLYYIPFRYDNYSLISEIAKLQPGESVTIIGKVTVIKSDYTKQRFKTIQKATISDNTGNIDIIWFNQPYLSKMIHVGDMISIAGKVEKNFNKLQFTSPEYELLTIDPVTNKPSPTIHTGRLVPIYHETQGITSKWLRRQIYKLLDEEKHKMLEHLPTSIITRLDLDDYSHAIEQIHFPNSLESSKKARERLAFDELFSSQLAAIQRRTIWKQKLIGQPFAIEKFRKNIEDVTKSLPFELTTAQKKALQHILGDMEKEEPMNRLLEGDVGSGKTVVAAIAMYMAYLNGYQSVIMAPTEILAQQHFATVTQLLERFGVKVILQTGSKKGIKNQESRINDKFPSLRKGQGEVENSKNKQNSDSFDILVGTHAVLSKHINFDKLGLVVIDEQQRFGVEQRSLIRTKGKNPHFLTMTATPIPRTIALTMYGDLDLSLLDELPKGRKEIKTWFVTQEKRKGAYDWIAKQIKETDSQVFIICPFIEESESMSTVKAATKEYENLAKNVWPHLKLGMLHGKMKSKEKDDVLEKFRNKAFDILVATPVVEVGIDIPNATIIMIEAAERFGLSQLHQLRGRVGRGDKQSYCLLFSESRNPQTVTRLKALERMHIGAELAEFDLRLRGAGDMYGTAQHGSTFFKIATFSDVDLIEKAKLEAEKIFPELNKYPLLVEKLNNMQKSDVSPD